MARRRRRKETNGLLDGLKPHAHRFFRLSLFASDIGMAYLAFYVAYLLRLQTEYVDISDTFQTYWGMAFIHILCVIMVFFFYRLYHRKRGMSHIDEFYLIFGASSVGAVVGFAFISFIYKNQLDYPRLMMVYAWLLTILFVTFGRFIHARLRWWLHRNGWGIMRILIVGTGDVGKAILRHIHKSPGLGYDVVGFISHCNGKKSVFEVPVLGESKDIAAIIEREQIDEVIIGMPEASHEEILTIIGDCENGRVSIKVFPDVFQIMATEVSIDELNGFPLLAVRDVALRGWRLMIKRAMDLVFSILFLIFASPFMLITAILVKLDSRGPAFFIQERMGLDGKPFSMIKFRSMKQNAESETGPVWTTPDDNRRTRLGEFIRRYSIDETPQFINVLFGEMSIVGPRPERPVFVEQFKEQIPRYMERHREKAGITGWAQINGLRGDTSIFERTKYDLWYIENWSILLDIKIMLKTAINTFFDKNAY